MLSQTIVFFMYSGLGRSVDFPGLWSFLNLASASYWPSVELRSIDSPGARTSGSVNCTTLTRGDWSCGKYILVLIECSMSLLEQSSWSIETCSFEAKDYISLLRSLSLFDALEISSLYSCTGSLAYPQCMSIRSFSGFSILKLLNDFLEAKFSLLFLALIRFYFTLTMGCVAFLSTILSLLSFGQSLIICLFPPVSRLLGQVYFKTRSVS